MAKRIFLLHIALVLYVLAFSKPARPGRIELSQPDGTTFGALFYGDEFMRIKVTESGHAIVQDRDGWWCYAIYDDNGVKINTGSRVGDNVPFDILHRSSEIPFRTIASNASAARKEIGSAVLMERGVLSRIAQRSLTRTGTSGQTTKYALVILAQFKDEELTYKKEDFVNLLNQEGYSQNGATGSARQYFEDQFQGKYNFRFDVSDVVTLSREMAYYGKNGSDDQDQNPHLMVIEACQLADSMIDFSRYDQDNDGEVENVFVFYAGEDEAEGASEDHIWAHSWYIKDGAGVKLVLDGVAVNHYACASELVTLDVGLARLAPIGTFCHEYAHTLGLPDLYDTDYQSGGYSAGTWLRNSLMDGGNYNNNGNTPPNFTSIEREILQINEPEILNEAGTYTLGSIAEGRYFRLDSDNPGEYFLFECRTGTGWDKYLGGDGMLVYHIDKSDNPAGYSEVYDRDVTASERWVYGNEVNALSTHQCADLIEADGRTDRFTSVQDNSFINYLRSPSGLFFPSANARSLTPKTEPGLVCWANGMVNRSLMDISYSDNQVTFRLTEFYDGEMPVATDVRTDVFQDAAILTFTGSIEFGGTAEVVCEHSGQPLIRKSLKPYQDNRWACVLEGLNPSTSYKVYITFALNDAEGDVYQFSFMTKRKQPQGYPYIYLHSVDRAENGLFRKGTPLPLRLFNAQDAKEIRWTFDDEPVAVGADGYYKVTKDGTLKAYITWEDGSEEVVLKEINLVELYYE